MRQFNSSTQPTDHRQGAKPASLIHQSEFPSLTFEASAPESCAGVACGIRWSRPWLSTKAKENGS